MLLWGDFKSTTNALKNGLLMVDENSLSFLEVYHFVDRCLKYKQDMEAAMAAYREVFKDMQNQVEQSKIAAFFTKSSALCII